MTTKKLLLAALLAAPSALAAMPAQAQVSGIASADPSVAVYRTKALLAANQQIDASFKSNFDQIRAKLTEREKLLSAFDKNKDNQLDDAEQKAIPAASQTQLQGIEKSISDLRLPVVRAQAFAIEMILQRYQEAQKAVVAAKKISVILAPNAVVYAPDAADVTPAITAELDRLAPSVPVTAPANWRPTQETVQIQQQFAQFQQIEQRIAASQQQGAQPAAGAAPAAPARPQPQGR